MAGHSNTHIAPTAGIPASSATPAPGSRPGAGVFLSSGAPTGAQGGGSQGADVGSDSGEAHPFILQDRQLNVSGLDNYEISSLVALWSSAGPEWIRLGAHEDEPGYWDVGTVRRRAQADARDYRESRGGEVIRRREGRDTGLSYYLWAMAHDRLERLARGAAVRTCGRFGYLTNENKAIQAHCHTPGCPQCREYESHRTAKPLIGKLASLSHRLRANIGQCMPTTPDELGDAYQFAPPPEKNKIIARLCLVWRRTRDRMWPGYTWPEVVDVHLVREANPLKFRPHLHVLLGPPLGPGGTPITTLFPLLPNDLARLREIYDEEAKREFPEYADKRWVMRVNYVIYQENPGRHYNLVKKRLTYNARPHSWDLERAHVAGWLPPEQGEHAWDELVWWYRFKQRDYLRKIEYEIVRRVTIDHDWREWFRYLLGVESGLRRHRTLGLLRGNKWEEYARLIGLEQGDETELPEPSPASDWKPARFRRVWSREAKKYIWEARRQGEDEWVEVRPVTPPPDPREWMCPEIRAYLLEVADAPPPRELFAGGQNRPCRCTGR